MTLDSICTNRVTRRDFGRLTAKGLLLAAVGSSLALDGCNVAQDILNWEPLGLAAFNGVVTMLETFGVITADPALVVLIGLIRTAFSDLAADAQLYLSIQPPPAGALAEIQAVLALIAGNIKTLFSQIQTNFAPIINLIIGLAQLILGTIAGFLNQIAAKSGQKTLTLSNTFEVGRTMYAYTPITPSPKTFRSDWNAVCKSQGHPEISI